MLIPVVHPGESHSPVVHELWVLVVAGSNPASPTHHEAHRCERGSGWQRAHAQTPLESLLRVCQKTGGPVERARLVLVVDDDPDNREMLAQFFRDAGFEALTAANGREALDLLTTSGQPEPLLILLDLEMPVMSGWDFLETVRLYHRLSRIPIVVQTGSAKTISARGVTAVVRKPVDPVDLVARVKRGDFGPPSVVAF